jgi:hypothetical protein
MTAKKNETAAEREWRLSQACAYKRRMKDAGVESKPRKPRARAVTSTVFKLWRDKKRKGVYWCHIDWGDVVTYGVRYNSLKRSVQMPGVKDDNGKIERSTKIKRPQAAKIADRIDAAIATWKAGRTEDDDNDDELDVDVESVETPGTEEEKTEGELVSVSRGRQVEPPGVKSPSEVCRDVLSANAGIGGATFEQRMEDKDISRKFARQWLKINVASGGIETKQTGDGPTQHTVAGETVVLDMPATIIKQPPPLRPLRPVSKAWTT